MEMKIKTYLPSGVGLFSEALQNQFWQEFHLPYLVPQMYAIHHVLWMYLFVKTINAKYCFFNIDFIYVNLFIANLSIAQDELQWSFSDHRHYVRTHNPLKLTSKLTEIIKYNLVANVALQWGEF